MINIWHTSHIVHFMWPSLRPKLLYDSVFALKKWITEMHLGAKS